MVTAMTFAARGQESSRFIRYGLACAALLWACAPAIHANEVAELDDVAARMQYAYYTRDERALRNGIGALERMNVPDQGQGWREYQLGVGYWHLAELSRSGGATILKGCEEHLATATRLQPALMEAKAVRGLCALQRTAARSTNARAVTRECSRQPDVAEALDRAPRNPRVLYVRALCAMQDGDAVAARDHGQRALSAFERPRAETEAHSTWGQAESCVLLARLALDEGDRTAARDLIEQALVLVPDYVAARELLAQIATAR